MAKALVIKGANFSTNKVATIEFDEEIPCTGITLSDSALTPSYLGTDTITATVTPADTTDAVQWSTSNQNVVTVENGAITAVGIGTAVITATCGNYSDTCTVTVTASAMSGTAVAGARVNGTGAYDSGNGLGYISSASKHGAIASATGTLPLYVFGSSLPDTYYPYILPKNTGKIKVTQTGSDILKVKCAFFNSATNAGSSYSDVVELIHIEEITFTGSVCEITVQNYQGFNDTDSFAISFEQGSSFSSSDFNKVTVEFVPVSDT